MKYVAPIAKSLGIPFEDTAAMIGIMGNAGIIVAPPSGQHAAIGWDSAQIGTLGENSLSGGKNPRGVYGRNTVKPTGLSWDTGIGIGSMVTGPAYR